MDFTYTFMYDTALDVSMSWLRQVCDKALSRARLKAPIKTGNLRRSIKYKIQENTIIFYIDKTMYDVPYYEYVDNAPKKNGAPRRGNGYWLEAIVEFGNVLYANLDKQFAEQIKREKDAEKRRIEIERKNAEIRRRNEEREQMLELLKQLAIVYAISQLGAKNERQKR